MTSLFLCWFYSRHHCIFWSFWLIMHSHLFICLTLSCFWIHLSPICRRPPFKRNESWKWLGACYLLVILLQSSPIPSFHHNLDWRTPFFYLLPSLTLWLGMSSRIWEYSASSLRIISVLVDSFWLSISGTVNSWSCESAAIFPGCLQSHLRWQRKWPIYQEKRSLEMQVASFIWSHLILQ